MSRDREVAAIAAELESLLDELRDNVTSLNAILAPDPPGAAQEEAAHEPA